MSTLHATAEPPHLLQMLQVLHLAHWHDPLLQLCQRFDGWACDYLQQPESSPDYRPMVDVLRLVQRYQTSAAGDDESYANAVGTCDFLARAALDRFEGEVSWNPFSETYREFARRFPDRFPYWSTGPALPGPDLVSWLLEQLRTSAAGRCGPSGSCQQ